MKIIIFLITLCFSSNLLSATYLICDNYENEINFKISFKNIFVKSSNDDEYVSYKQSIQVWNKEIIQFTKNEKYFYSTSKNWDDYTVSEQAACNQCEKDNPNQSNAKTGYIDATCLDVCMLSEYIESSREIKITIDRVTGLMNWDGEEYQCEVKKKTLF